MHIQDVSIGRCCWVGRVAHPKFWLGDPVIEAYLRLRMILQV